MKRFPFILALLIALILPLESHSQEKETFTSQFMRFIIQDGDTVYVETLPAAIKFSGPKRGKEGKAWRKYWKLVHNFSKTYPYALVAKEKILEADEYIKNNNLSKKERANFLKGVEKDLFATFEKPLRKLTFTQGRLLMRMIERETGLSAYYIIKHYRSGTAAGFWQGVAKIFGADLKIPYNKFGADRDTEELINLYQKGHFNHLYISIFGKMPPKPIVTPKKDYPQTILW